MSQDLDERSHSHSNSHSSSSMLIRSRTMFAEFCQRMRPHLKGVARQQTQRLPNCKDDESDIVQIAVTKAYEKIDQFQGRSTRQCLAWLVQIVRNTARDVQRFWTQERRSHKHEEHDSHVMKCLADGNIDTPSKVLAKEEARQLIDAAIATLKIEHQQLIRWRAFQEVTFQEIAHRLHITEPTARKRCKLAMAEFKNAMSQLEV